MFKMVLLPGMDGTGRLFEPFVKALPAEVKSHIIDFPRRRNLSYSELIDVIGSELSDSEPYVLLAESFSTPIAIQLAAKSPSNLIAIVLCAGFGRSPIQGWRKNFASLLVGVLLRLPMTELTIRRVLLDSKTPRSTVHAVRSAISSVSKAVLSFRMKSVLSCDVLDQTRQISIPVLYLQGLRDRLVPQRCVDEILRALPELEVACLNGPHLLLQSRPLVAADLVCEFIKRVVRSGKSG